MLKIKSTKKKPTKKEATTKKKISTEHEVKFARLWSRKHPDILLFQEYIFSKKRNFRLDFAHLTAKVGIEVNGGIWMTHSGHSYGNGLIRDYTKNNLAIAEGWVIFQLSPEMITLENLTLIASVIYDRLTLLDANANLADSKES